MGSARIATREPVGSRSRLLLWARDQLGTTERTPGSPPTDCRHNRIDAWQREFGLSGVAWCGCFVGYGLRVVAGIADIDDRIVWVPFIPEDARAGRHGWSCLVPAVDAVPGDVGLLCWNAEGEPEHTGFVIANHPTRRVMRTIEGNTTTGDDGDQSRGGGVFERERPYDCIVACARPRYPGADLQVD
jgi:hypothetical protein